MIDVRVPSDLRHPSVKPGGATFEPLPKTLGNKRMEIIFLLILISLVVAAGFLLAYFWAARNGQFDDDYTPSVRILFDDDILPINTTNLQSTQTSDEPN